MDKSSVEKKNLNLVNLKENETYFWCTYGKSSTLPLVFTAKKLKMFIYVFAIILKLQHFVMALT